MLGELLISAGLALAIDQASKKLAFQRFGEGKTSPSVVGWKPRLRPLLNTTIALGLIRDRRTLVLLWGFAALGTIVLIFHAPAFQTWAARVGFGAALGGATSNLIDWLRRGAVMDFIDLRHLAGLQFRGCVHCAWNGSCAVVPVVEAARRLPPRAGRLHPAAAREACARSCSSGAASKSIATASCTISASPSAWLPETSWRTAPGCPRRAFSWQSSC